MAESNIRGASLDGILERLSNAPEYHPLEAETFADWSMEAGDIVTLSRGGRNYHSPIHESTVNWRKHQQVTVSSKGTQERKSISKLSQQRYNRGGGGARRNDYWSMVVSDATGKLQAGIELTYSSARMWVDNANELMHSELALTASTARLWVENAKAGLKSELAMTASTAKLWVESLYDQMESGLDITLSSAMLYTQNRTTRAYIMTRINADGEGEALIDADKITLTGTTTIKKLLSGDAWLGTLKVENLYVRGQEGMATLPVKGCLNSAVVENNTLKLYNMTGELVATFSKATSLSGTWSSGHLTVTAKQGSTTVATHNEYVRGGSPEDYSSDGNKWYVPILASDNPYSGGSGTGARIYVNAQSVYDRGYEDGGGGGGGTHNIDIPNSGIGTHESDPGGILLTVLKNAISEAQAHHDWVRFRVDCGGSSKYYKMNFG